MEVYCKITHSLPFNDTHQFILWFLVLFHTAGANRCITTPIL